jgi:hypothetical protein
MIRVWGAWVACLLAFSAPLAARDTTSLTLVAGARVGVISLLDPEVTHFHAAKALKDSFLKTQSVNWAVDAMLSDALKERMGQMGLVLVPLGVTDALDKAREDCFLNGSFAKALPKECVLPFAHLAGADHVDAIIVLAPGLNNSTHAGSARRKDLPDYLRGWGFVTGGPSSPGGKPTLFNMTELLLIAPLPEGPALRGREWGGSYALEWTDFASPADLKEIPPQDLDQLQRLFAGILSRQTGRLLDQMTVRP